MHMLHASHPSGKASTIKVPLVGSWGVSQKPVWERVDSWEDIVPVARCKRITGPRCTTKTQLATPLHTGLMMLSDS